jgi:hypothetical protein
LLVEIHSLLPVIAVENGVAHQYGHVASFTVQYRK